MSVFLCVCVCVRFSTLCRHLCCQEVPLYVIFFSLEVGAKVITPFSLVFLSLICLFLVIAFALIEVTLPSFSIEFFALFVFVVESASSPINE